MPFPATEPSYGRECLTLADATGATDRGDHEAALTMVTMQGGVFGAVRTPDDLVGAVPAGAA